MRYFGSKHHAYMDYRLYIGSAAVDSLNQSKLVSGMRNFAG
jgi:hypothetical protein